MHLQLAQVNLSGDVVEKRIFGDLPAFCDFVALDGRGGKILLRIVDGIFELS